ncbi:MAG TPA: OmpA family protein [Polyangiaceae bacterium]|jgi:peptidoglycan-associated lipoprotein
MNTASYLATCSALLLAACSTTHPPARAADVATAANTPAPTASPAPRKSPDSSVKISDEIRRACGLSDEDAYFAFDSARVTNNEYDVLKRVATCFESGPLAGKSMKLVGHADPRGDDDYNLVLGGHRADAVKEYLNRAGLRESKMATTSRGEMDASGTDEASWAKDRRVDIMVAN